MVVPGTVISLQLLVLLLQDMVMDTPDILQKILQFGYNGREVAIVGRVSMDMLAVDLTDHPDVRLAIQLNYGELIFR